MAQIDEAVIGMLTDVDAIKKDRQNKQQGYQFRGIDDVYNAVHPLLAKHGVYPTCKVLSAEYQERETAKGGTLFYCRGRFEYTFRARDGSCIASEALGEAMDSGDKASNKAMSNGYKYALFQMLCIPTEAIDGDSDSYGNVKPQGKTDDPPRQNGKQSFGKPPEVPPTPEERAAKAASAIEQALLLPDPKETLAQLKKLRQHIAAVAFTPPIHQATMRTYAATLVSAIRRLPAAEQREELKAMGASFTMSDLTADDMSHVAGLVSAATQDLAATAPQT